MCKIIFLYCCFTVGICLGLDNHLQQVTQLLNHLTPQNSVEANSKAFFTAYLHMKNNIFSTQDSLELHRLVRGCTARDGFAVPQARVLYRLKFKDFTNFFDNCNNSIAYRPVNIAIYDNPKDTELVIYPNPSTGEVWLKVENENSNAELLLYSINGALVHNETIHTLSNSHKITYNFENGVYIAFVKTQTKTYVGRVVIIE